MHRRSLARFDLDSVPLPFNVFMAQDDRYRRTVEEVLAICRERNVAVQVIKSIARGPWATTERTHTTWLRERSFEDPSSTSLPLRGPRRIP